MLRKEEEIRDKAVWDAAQDVLLAVRTAPKTRGRDNLTILVADGDEKEMLAAKMDEVFEKSGGTKPTFARDAKGVVAASAVVLIGVKAEAYGLNCGWCGWPTCGEKPAAVPCSFGSIDLGIGSGVAAAVLAERHIDNRMMYSMGYAAVQLGWFPEGVVMALGFPLSATGKNPFFDRG